MTQDALVSKKPPHHGGFLLAMPLHGAPFFEGG